MKSLNGFGKFVLTMIVGWSAWLGLAWVRTMSEIGTQSSEMAVVGVALAAFSAWIVPVGIGTILLMLLGRKRPEIVVIVKDATTPHTTSYEVKGRVKDL